VKHLHPDTPVFGVFECRQCGEIRPVLSRRVRSPRDRVYRCSRCIERISGKHTWRLVGDVQYFDNHMTLEYFKKVFPKFDGQKELFT